MVPEKSEDRGLLKRFIQDPIAKGFNAFHNKIMNYTGVKKDEIIIDEEDKINELSDDYDIVSPVTTIADLSSTKSPDQFNEGT